MHRWAKKQEKIFKNKNQYEIQTQRGFSGNNKADFHLAPITLVSMDLLWQDRGNNSKTLNKSCIFKRVHIVRAMLN